MSNHDCCDLGKTRKNRESDVLDVFFDVGSTKESKLRFKCSYLYEGRKRNDSLCIVSGYIYVENIEIKT